MFEEREADTNRQGEFWVERKTLPRATPNAFYRKLGAALKEMGFAEAVRVNGQARSLDPLKSIEIIVNGTPVLTQQVPADGEIHHIEATIPIERSSWVAVRQFPQLHSNPVNVMVGDEPIRASRDSARWCIEMTELLWKNRENRIAEDERDEAREAFDHTIETFRAIAAESP